LRKSVLFPFFVLSLLVLVVGMACGLGANTPTVEVLPTATLPLPEPATELDFNLDPNFGEQALASGFTPDPFETAITSGGYVDVSYLGAGCAGFATAAPDFRLRWDGTSSMLRIMFLAASEDDTTLVVNLPDGSFLCNDDAVSGELNPMVELLEPAAGIYDIWVGSYAADAFVGGTLRITELGLTPSDASSTSAGMLDFSLEPNYGAVALSHGFTPDPHVLPITSGGDVDASYLGEGCTGFATAAPDFRLNWTGSSPELRFLFTAAAGEDTTLLVNLPDGTFLCNDDSASGNLNPMISVENPAEGVYDIWVGSYASGTFASGELRITETNLTP
jgi:hypothetical protein